MVKPSAVLQARLRFTTKQVAGGFYRGNRTGSTGAHTKHGGYVIDWRKVRHFVVPDLKDFKLGPFVTKRVAPTPNRKERPDGSWYIPKAIDGREYLKAWMRESPEEVDSVNQWLGSQNQQNSDAEAK